MKMYNRLGCPYMMLICFNISDINNHHRAIGKCNAFAMNTQVFIEIAEISAN